MLRGLVPIAVALTFAACARAVDVARGGEAPEAFPGFDTSRYPGDAAMRAWRAPGSPYVWVGYYLPAPCRRDASWSGTRARLAEMGWGFAVLYVGQQQWDGVPDRAPTDTAAPPAANASATETAPACSRTLLSAAQGRREADDAMARTASEGFPAGTVIWLDIELVSTVTPALRDYYTAWVETVRASGRFRPGVYVHRRNAAAIAADLGGVPLWVANVNAEFSPTRAPRRSGFADAAIWQGRVNVDETHNGVTLRIDANSATRPSPSGALLP